uniref:Uncharacterized protein n=1 Tax=Mus spicilegus TaxID=10103 RepID=A0A8C6HRE0_MUSSI
VCICCFTTNLLFIAEIRIRAIPFQLPSNPWERGRSCLVLFIAKTQSFLSDKLATHHISTGQSPILYKILQEFISLCICFFVFQFILLHGNKVADESLSQSLLQALILLQGGKGIFHLQRDLGRFWLIQILTLIGTSRSTITALKTIQACCHSGRQHQGSASIPDTHGA